MPSYSRLLPFLLKWFIKAGLVWVYNTGWTATAQDMSSHNTILKHIKNQVSACLKSALISGCLEGNDGTTNSPSPAWTLTGALQHDPGVTRKLDSSDPAPLFLRSSQNAAACWHRHPASFRFYYLTWDVSWVNGKLMQNQKQLGLGLLNSCEAPGGDISSSPPCPSLSQKRSHTSR